MTGVPAHPRDAQTVKDLRLLRARGLTMAEAAKALGMSRATAYRILNEAAYRPRGQRR